MDRRGLLAGAGALLLAGSAHARSAARLWIDGLSFLPEDMSEIRAAGLDAMICDVSAIQTVKAADGSPKYLRGFEANDPAIEAAVARLAASDAAYLALKGSDIGKKPGCAAFLQMQSTEMMGDDLSRLAYFHGKGLRIVQFTHHNDTPYAGGAIEPVQHGLTPLGIEGLAEMNRLRLLPDVSHGAEATMLDAARLSKTPIILSHGAARAIVDHPRCASDAVIRTIAEKGGMMGLFMMSFWLTRDPVPTPDHYVAQLRHIIKVGGIGAVGISNDFPMTGEASLVKLGNNNVEGVKGYLDWWRAMDKRGVPGFGWTPEHVVIPEYNNIHRMERIAATLERARFTGAE
ncbi:MAG: peptidase M19, partial [Sphingomonadales bacterium]